MEENVVCYSAIIAAGISVLMTFLLFILKEIIDVVSCYQAIMTELRTLKFIFNATFVEEIEKSKKDGYLNMLYPLGTNYFTMYEKNCDKVGKIPFKNKRKLIVSCYTVGKYFLDCLRTNNRCLEERCNVDPNDTSSIANINKNLKESFYKNILPTSGELQQLFAQIKE